jgi:hypothetical protein
MEKAEKLRKAWEMEKAKKGLGDGEGCERSMGDGNAEKGLGDAEG